VADHDHEHPELAEIPEPGLLRALAEKGRTKRIRRNATTTLRGR
jgi:hypothetical protein